MPKILVLCPGISARNEIILESLRGKKWELIIKPVPVSAKCAYLAKFEDLKFKIIRRRRMPMIPLHKYISTFIERTRVCEKAINNLAESIDLIFQFQGLFMPTLNFGRLRIPYLVFTDYTMKLSETYPPWLSSNMKKWCMLERQLYQRAALNIVINESAQRSLLDNYAVRHDKIIQLNVGSRLSGHFEEPKYYDGRTILFVGEDFRRKGGEVLLEAFRKVKSVISQAKLIIAGPKIVDINSSDAGVIPVGFVSARGELELLYQKASVFVLPSFVEPSALSLLEAMDYKLPCIGTNVDGTPQIIEDGKTGFIVPVGNAEILAERIITLLENKDLAKRMGESGYLRLQERYRWDKFSQTLDEHLRNIIA